MFPILPNLSHLKYKFCVYLKTKTKTNKLHFQLPRRMQGIDNGRVVRTTQPNSKSTKFKIKLKKTLILFQDDLRVS